MAEGVAGKALFPAKTAFMPMDMPGEIKGVNRLFRIKLFWEKPSHGFTVRKPVPGEQIKGGQGKDGIAVVPCFGMADVDAHIFPVNVFIAETADFANAKP